jgi:hypothetical protein
MHFLRQYQFLLLFLAVLFFSSVMVVRQMERNHGQHAQVREAFILLHTRGHDEHAQRLYNRLVGNLRKMPDRTLIEDFQRTLPLVDPETVQVGNLLWSYHTHIRRELEQRVEKNIIRALELAEK